MWNPPAPKRVELPPDELVRARFKLNENGQLCWRAKPEDSPINRGWNMRHADRPVSSTQVELTHEGKRYRLSPFSLLHFLTTTEWPVVAGVRFEKGVRLKKQIPRIQSLKAAKGYTRLTRETADKIRRHGSDD